MSEKTATGDYHSQCQGKIIIHDRRGVRVYLEEDIVYLKAEGRYTRIFFSDNKSWLCAKLLKDFETALSSDFVRIHRSYIFNTSHIFRVLTKDNLQIDDNLILSVSRRRHKMLKMKIMNGLPQV